jgi:hypothetical protein
MEGVESIREPCSRARRGAGYGVALESPEEEPYVREVVLSTAVVDVTYVQGPGGSPFERGVDQFQRVRPA